MKEQIEKHIRVLETQLAAGLTETQWDDGQGNSQWFGTRRAAEAEIDRLRKLLLEEEE